MTNLKPITQLVNVSDSSADKLVAIENYFSTMVENSLKQMKLDPESIQQLIKYSKDNSQNLRSITRKFFPLFQKLKDKIDINPDLYFAIMVRSIFLLNQFSNFRYEGQDTIINVPFNQVRHEKSKNKSGFKNIELDNLIDIVLKSINSIDEVVDKVSLIAEDNVRQISLEAEYYNLFITTQAYNLVKQLPALMGVYLLLIIMTKPQALVNNIPKNISLIIDLISDLNVFIHPLNYNLIQEFVIENISGYRKTTGAKLTSVRQAIVEYSMTQYLIDMLILDINTAPNNWLSVLAIYYPEIDPYLRDGLAEFLKNIKNKVSN